MKWSKEVTSHILFIKLHQGPHLYFYINHQENFYKNMSNVVNSKKMCCKQQLIDVTSIYFLQRFKIKVGVSNKIDFKIWPLHFYFYFIIFFLLDFTNKAWKTKYIFRNSHLRESLLQCKPLNGITLVQRQSDNINRMITLTEDIIYQPYELNIKFWVITDLKIKNL